MDIDQTTFLTLAARHQTNQAVNTFLNKLDITVIKQLQKLSIQEINLLAKNFSAEVVSVTINAKTLCTLLDSLHHLEQDTNLFAADFIKNDLSTPLLVSLLGLTSHEINAMRYLMNNTGKGALR